MGKTKNTEKGICHACGEELALSFEHIPPKSVGNSNLSKTYSMIDIIERQGFEPIVSLDGLKYKTSQRGSGVRTICERCNNYFGANYVDAYKDIHIMTSQVFITDPPEERETGHCFTTDKMHVLAFFKHVISNFCATTTCGSMADCKDFLLDRESNAFPKRYRLFMFALPDPGSKIIMTGWQNMLTTVDPPSGFTVAYIKMHPFGFALFDLDRTTSDPPPSGCDITAMAQQSWGEYPVAYFELPYDRGGTSLPVFANMQ